MKRNLFTAALESEVQGTVGPEAVTEQSTLQPQPGVGEDKTGEVSLDEVKVDKEFGEDAEIAAADDTDAVAESQEHTLALEHLQSTVLRFCRMGAALEEIAETAEANLAAGNPLEPSTVALVATAVDAAGIGEPLQEGVALESFEFSPQVATEGFIDAVKDRAAKVWAAVAKFFKKAWDLTVEKLKRAADFFRSLDSIYGKLEKEADLLASNAGKAFQSAKYEKAVQDSIYAPASTKTVQAAVSNAAAECKELVQLADVKLHSEIRALNNAWSGEKPEAVVAAMNKVLAVAKALADTGRTRFKHSSTSVEVNLPDRVTLEATGGLEGTKVVFDNGTKDFSAGLRTASLADVKTLRESARQADRLTSNLIQDLFNDELFKPMQGKTRFDFDKDDREVARKLLNKYVNLLRISADLSTGCIWGGIFGMWSNHTAATKWVRFSVAEAKAAKRDAK